MSRRLALLLILIPALGWASDSNIGTSGAQFLKIGAGARPTGMGEAFVGLADDINAVYYNPAGLSQLTSPQIMAMHTQWIQDVNYDFGAFALPTKVGSFGISAATLKVSDQDKRGADESLEGQFDTLDSAYALSYGRVVLPQFSLGATARFINQEIDSASAQTWSGDVGGLYQFGQLPLSLGLAARHMGPEIKFNEESDPLPFTLDLGVGVKLMDQKLILGLDLRTPRDQDLQFGFGTEWNQPLRNEMGVSARAGYNSATTDADGTSGLSLGGGLHFKQFGLDVAWVPFGDLGNTFRYAAMVKF